MKDILAKNSILEYITIKKKVKEGEEKDKSILKWREKDQKALVMIHIRIADKVVIDITNAIIAHKAWMTLEKTFGPWRLSAIVSCLQQLFRTTCDKNGDVETHICTIRAQSILILLKR